ncbi:isoamylase early set domain-containing protein [Chloroflexi bacterium TSY]|nr:isoamylase early set domain-containing protein [Chloroflexi bacterium TSY]
MIVKSKSPTPGHVRITFELPVCIWADKIYLTGDFNQWSQKSTPMIQERDGVWRVTIDLPVGTEHEFRYIVDGEWTTDYHADELSTNVYGSQNSLVRANYPMPKSHCKHINDGTKQTISPEVPTSSDKVNATRPKWYQLAHPVRRRTTARIPVEKVISLFKDQPNQTPV